MTSLNPFQGFSPPGLNRRGQLFSVDLLFALTIFLFALTFSIVFSNQLAVRIEAIESFNHRQDLAHTAMNALLADQGRPANWHKLATLATTDSLGLARSRNLLAPEKVQGLVDANSSYTAMKTILGLARYDFQFTITDLNGTRIAVVGTSPDTNSNTVAINRLALYKGREAIAQLRVFD